MSGEQQGADVPRSSARTVTGMIVGTPSYEGYGMIQESREIYLRQNAVAFLGGLARLIQWRGGHAAFAWDTVARKIQRNLAKQGFQAAFGAGSRAPAGNSIPYREDLAKDHRVQTDYLKRQWLGRGWVNVSQRLRDAIVGHVWEIYANAFEHAYRYYHDPNYRQALDQVLDDRAAALPSGARW